VGNLALRVISLGLVFICHLLLTRLLGTHDYGIYAYALAWIKALCVPATLGLERLVIREVATFRVHSDWSSWHGLLLWASRMLLVASVSIALSAVAVSWLIADYSHGLYAFWLAMALLPMLALLRLKQFVLQGIHRPIIGQIPETLVHPLLLTTLIAAYFVAGGRLTVTWAMALNVAATFVALLCGAVLLERNLPQAVKESTPMAQPQVWMRSVVPMLLVSGVNTFNGQIPVLMLGAMGDAEAAGILSVAKRLADLVVLPTLALSAVLTPTLTTLWVARDKRGLQRIMTKSSRGVTLISLPLAVGFIIFGHQLLKVFGTSFTVGTRALTVLCVGQIINVLAGSNGILLVMTGHERDAAFISTACAVLNCVLCASLIPYWGTTGAAAGAVTSLIVWNLWLVARSRRRLGIRPTIFARLVERSPEES
jgi:O-antigen/teichoic acid export membrane protein